MDTWRAREAQRKGLDATAVWDGLIWTLVGGIIGARLLHVIPPLPRLVAAGLTTTAYFANPIQILEIWNGGLGIPGGVVGGLLGLWAYTHRYRLNFAMMVDIAAPGLIRAQAIGRWGNFANQAFYGQLTNLPWGIYIAPAYHVLGYAQFEYFQPTFLYESLLNLLGCLVLLWITRRFAQQLKPGDVFLLYLVFYSIVRFGMERLRLDSTGLGDFNINQPLSVIVILVVGLWLVIRHRSPGHKSLNTL